MTALAFARRLAVLSDWLREADWHAGEPGPRRGEASRIADELRLMHWQLQLEIVEHLATPAERRRAEERAARSEERNAQAITFAWQHRARRGEYLRDRAEETRDRQRAIGRAWAALEKHEKSGAK